MTYTHKQAAGILGIHKRTIGKAISNHVKCHGEMPPGVDAERHLSHEFLDWFRVERTINLGGRTVRYVDESRSEPARVAPHVQAQVSGLTPASRVPDGDELWSKFIGMQRQDEAKTESRYDQRITIPDSKPSLIFVMGDLHFINRHCDYASAKYVAELAARTPGGYVIVAGDTVDNWVGSERIQAIQKEQPGTLAEEQSLLRTWLSIVAPKLIAVVSGNHEARSYDAVGIDLLMDALRGVPTLYDQNEVRFSLRLGQAAWRWKVRHVWKSGRSMWSDSYGMEKDARLADGEWDVAVGAHWHSPTVFREFYDHAYDHKIKLAIQLGAFELDSSYGRKLNFPRSVPGGVAALMVWPNGQMQPWRDLEAATRFLAAERTR